ncbi:MAG: hypothetical protein AB1749_06760 [Pseudomonadota bacterium]
MTTVNDTTTCQGCIGLMLETVGMIALSVLAFAAPLVAPALVHLFA